MTTCLQRTPPPLTLEKAAAVKPPDLPPLDINDLTSKSDDSAPLSVNDQVRLDFMVGMGNPPMKFPLPVAIIGRAKRAPHWGVQSRFRVIYIYIYMYVCRYVSYVKLTV